MYALLIISICLRWRFQATIMTRCTYLSFPSTATVWKNIYAYNRGWKDLGDILICFGKNSGFIATVTLHYTIIPSYLEKTYLAYPCLNSCLLFQNAYTTTAINGTDFCTSAKDAFQILSKNSSHLTSVNCFGNFVIFLGKVRCLD